MNMMKQSPLVLGLWALVVASCAPAQAPSGVAPSAPAVAASPAASAMPSTMPSADASASPSAPGGAAEACEHMQQGPAVAVAAVAEGGASAPSVAADHKRYDVALTGGKGQVRFASGAAGELAVYSDAPATLALQSGAGQAVQAESIATSVGECGTIRGKWVFDVGVGPYVVTLEGPAKVGLVLEAGAHAH